MDTSDPTLLPGAVSAEERLRVLDSLLGFFDVKVLAAAIAKEIPDALANGPMMPAALAQATKLPERSIRFLLIALGGMNLVTRESAGYALSDLGRRYLVKGSPYYQGWYIRYWDWVADATTQLVKGLEKNEPVWEGFGHYLEAESESSREKQEIFNEAMTASQLFVAHAVLAHVDLGRSHRLLDIGGSFGRFASSAVSRFPNLSATVFDLPTVAARAKTQVATWGLASRVATHGGDFLTDAWPEGHDAVSFIRILNSRTDEVIDHCFKKAYDYLPAGGRIIVADAPILPPDGDALPQRQASRLSMLYFMASAGNVRTADAWGVLLRRAGFASPDKIAFDDPYGVITAVKA